MKKLHLSLTVGGLIVAVVVVVTLVLIKASISKHDSDTTETSQSRVAHQAPPAEGGNGTPRENQPVDAGPGGVLDDGVQLAHASAAGSYSSMLDHLAALDATYALDAYDLVSHANHLCGVMGGQDAAQSYLDLYQRGVTQGWIEQNRETEASYRLVDSVRAAFCDSAIALAGPQDAAQTFEQRRVEAARSPDFARLLELEEAFMVDGSDAPVAGMAEIAASTPSPSVFREAADRLAETGWIPPGYEAPGFAHPEQNHMIAGLGSLLAFCGLSPGACGPGSLTSTRACLPSNCRAGESLQQFLARNHTPDEFASAQAYAAALLAMRRR
jgi:hypothetical protein